MIFLTVLVFLSSESGRASDTQTPVDTNDEEQSSILDPKFRVGSWIWASETHDQQFCRLWRRFDIPKSPVVVNADLRVTADNTYQVFLDGRELGRGGDWRDLTDYDLTLVLEPGPHVIAVEAFNSFLQAGVVMGLQVKFADGKIMEIASDPGWLVVSDPNHGWQTKKKPEPDWVPATVIKPVGVPPWNHVFVPNRVRVQPINMHFWQDSWFQATLGSLCLMVAAACLWLMTRLTLQVQSQHVIQTERARIARDIHDDLTATLTQLVLLGEVTKSGLPAGSEPHQAMAKICEKARNLSRSMNEIIWVVNSQRDTLRDFTSYVCKYAEAFMQSTGIRCRFDVDEEIPNLPCNLGVRRNLFLAVKEALTNAARHSHATELILRIHLDYQQITVVIEDNGAGFEPVLEHRERNGLSNMKRRAAEAGGVCQIVSQPGAGCRVEFTVPLVRAVRGRFQLWTRSGLRDQTLPSRKAAS